MSPKLYDIIRKTLVVMLALVAVVFVLIIGKSFFIPLALATLLAFLLLPIADRMEKRGIPRIATNIILILAGITIIIGLMALFSFIIRDFISDVPTLRFQLANNIQEAQFFVFEKFGVAIADQEAWLGSRGNLFDIFSQNLSAILSATRSVVLTVGLLVVYLFFFLYYRDKFVTFLFKLTPKSNHVRFRKIVRKISSVTPQYLRGVIIVVSILAVLNSLGFWLIGVNHPILFGIIAAMLNIIPYLGTIFGFLTVAIFTLATQNITIALGVFLMFFVVQFTENNFLTPYITASQVKLNPLAAIVSIIVGGMVWGLAGMFLAIPFLAMAKIIFHNIPSLAPIAYLIGTEGTEKHALTWESIRKLFSKKSPKKRITNKK